MARRYRRRPQYGAWRLATRFWSRAFTTRTSRQNHQVEHIQGPALPLDDSVHHDLSNVANGFVGQFRAHRRREAMLDVADGHPSGIEADDHVTKTTQPPLTGEDQPRDEGAVTVPRAVARSHLRRRRPSPCRTPTRGGGPAPDRGRQALQPLIGRKPATRSNDSAALSPRAGRSKNPMTVRSRPPRSPASLTGN